MPVHKVSGGYKWGSKGHVYSTKAGAHKQEAAAYANGYTGKSVDPLDRVIGLTAMLAKAGMTAKRHYLKEGEKPPAGVEVHEGTRGGKYIEIGAGAERTDVVDAMDVNQLQAHADKLKDRKNGIQMVARDLEPHNPEAAQKVMAHWNRLNDEHEMIKDRIRAKVREGATPPLQGKQPQQPQHIKVPQLDAHGNPKQSVRPEFQDVQRELDEMKLPPQDEALGDAQSVRNRIDSLQRQIQAMGPGGKMVDAMRMSKRIQLLQDKLVEFEGGEDAEEQPQGKLGPQVQAAMGEFEQLQEKLKAGELENPQELVDAARRVAQAYEGDRQELGQGDVQKHALQGALDEATKQHDRAKELYESWKQRFEYARDKGAPAEEVKAARERLDAAEDEYHDARMSVHNADKALHHYTRGGQQQPAPAAPAPAPAASAHAGEARFPIGGAWDKPAAAAPRKNTASRQRSMNRRNQEARDLIAQQEKEREERMARAASANAKVPQVPEGPKKGHIGRVPRGAWGEFGAEPRDFGPADLFPTDFQAQRAAWKAGKNWVVRGPGGYQVADKMPAQGGDFMRIRPDGIIEHYRGKVKGAKAPRVGQAGGSTPAAFGPAGKHHAEKEIAKLGKEPDFNEVLALYNHIRGGEFARQLQGQHPDWTKQQLNRYWKAYYGAVGDAYRAAWHRKHEAGG